MPLNQENFFKIPGNSDFKSGLDVISGVVKSGKINTTKACKNLDVKIVMSLETGHVTVQIAEIYR